MLPKKSRLNLTKSFKFVVAGKKVDTPHFRLAYKEGENEHPAVGIAVSGKVFKKANLRNRARRLASSAIQSHYASLRKNLNLVIMPKATILQCKTERLIEELKNVKDIFNFN